MNGWTLFGAVRLARLVEPVACRHGAHVALTGGCLYKKGERKDCDLFFYSHRGGPGINRDGLLHDLEANGFEIGEKKGTVRKATYDGRPVDLFFRELPPEFECEGMTESAIASGATDLDDLAPRVTDFSTPQGD